MESPRSTTILQIFLYNGDWEDGNQVKFSGAKQLNLSFIDQQNKTIGILSENHDRLASVRGIHRSLQLLNMNDENFPQDVQAFEMFDIIMVDEYPISKFSDSRKQALVEWISAGGILIVGGTPNPVSTYGELNDLLPLKISGETTASPMLGANNQEPVQFDSIQIFTGEFEAATNQQSIEDTPILLSKSYGTGSIIQTAFSLGDQPVVSTEGYGSWLADYLLTFNTQQNFHYDIYHSLYWDYGELNEIFSESTISSGQLLIILIIYLLVIVPLLYFALKRMDKREHAWWLIPSLSITTSIIIFGFGAKDRLFNPLMNELGVFVAEDNHLNGFFTVSLQSNTSGNYVLKANRDEYNPVPISRNYYYGNVPESQIVYFEDQREQVSMTFPNVEYWSVRSISGKANSSVEGMFDYQLTLKEKNLSGTITNHYPYDFESMFIWTGTNEFDVGPMRAGETKEVDFTLKSSWLSRPQSSGYYNRQGELDDVIRQSLKDSVINRGYQTISSPVLAGYTKNQIVDVTMENKDAKANRTALILQPFEPEFIYTGEFSISNNEFSIELLTLEGQNSGFYPGMDPFWQNEMYLDPGVYQFIYQVPNGLQQENLVLNSLKIRFARLNDPIYIINQSTGELMGLNDLGTNIDLTENVNDYLTENNYLIFQVEKKNLNDPVVSLPQVTMKGSVEQ